MGFKKDQIQTCFIKVFGLFIDVKQQIESIKTFLHIIRYFETNHKPLKMRHLVTEENM